MWLRVADEAWQDPLDATYAQRHGGRWNAPASFPVLYVNADLVTAQAQVRHLLAGQPVNPEDLDPPWVLVAAALPRRQRVADAVTPAGLAALGLPRGYPLDDSGRPVPRQRCQPLGSAVRDAGLAGVSCRSAATEDGSGRELAWFPARRSSRARAVADPIPFDRWWFAADFETLLPDRA